MDSKQPTPLILHGHFYQPPRENPWIKRIPPQPGAEPFENWNEKIHAQCYWANTNSPFLDKDGNTLRRYNNYSYISFNFGPTLVDWLVQYHPETFEQIVEGDKASILRTGYGNAIAQGYNHTILPLDTPEDRRLQIFWGVDHFTKHFHRSPESIWLPETAIHPDTVDALIEAGVSYVILSPWQADSYLTEQGERIALEGSPIPSFEPYEIEGTKGSITAMFYHPDLASEISFGGILSSADTLYQRLSNLAEEHTGLIHTATDGEIYGHHSTHGDMALAALIEKVNRGNQLAFTNYAAYLATHKPTKRAILRSGEESKGTSWSCSHGVSRWYKDCGCSTGAMEGWNQQWRTPLRKGFEAISKEIQEIQQREIPKLTSVPIQELKENYILVLSKQVSPRDFALTHGKITNSSEQFSLCTFLEGETHRLYSFTSCGWFFGDLMDTATVQNIRHALRAIELYQPYAQTDLMGTLQLYLEQAKSNMDHGKSGKDIIEDILKEPKTD